MKKKKILKTTAGKAASNFPSCPLPTILLFRDEKQNPVPLKIKHKTGNKRTKKKYKKKIKQSG